MPDEVLIEDLLSMLEDFRESEASKEDVIDAMVEFIHSNLMTQLPDDEEEYSFIEDEEFEDEEDEDA